MQSPSSYTPYHMGNVPPECSSLIYTLNDSSLDFQEFALVIRDLHSYKVKGFEDNSDGNQVVVHLLYNASMKNVRSKLGNLPVTVNKCNPFVAPHELKTIEALRTKYKFGNPTTEEETEAPGPTKKRCYKKVSKPDV